MLNMKLLKDEATYEAYATENGTATDEDTNYGSTLLKQLVSHWVVRVERVFSAYYHFASVKPEKS